MNPSLCFCARIPQLSFATRVVLVVHAKELKRTTNSGRLATEALVNSEVRVRGEGREPLDLSDVVKSDYHSLLFYPADNAVELTPELATTLPRPIQLIVPDGSWRQAAKVHTRHPELAGVTRVMISRPNLARHHLRKESSEYGMSTLEAIAQVLAVLEGPERAAPLFELYREKLSATLKGRGVREA